MTDLECTEIIFFTVARRHFGFGSKRGLALTPGRVTQIDGEHATHVSQVLTDLSPFPVLRQEAQRFHYLHQGRSLLGIASFWFIGTVKTIDQRAEKINWSL